MFFSQNISIELKQPSSVPIFSHILKNKRYNGNGYIKIEIKILLYNKIVAAKPYCGV